MSKEQKDTSLVVRCPNCKQAREPDVNETTRHYVCSICGAELDALVFIEKRKRGLK